MMHLLQEKKEKDSDYSDSRNMYLCMLIRKEQHCRNEAYCSKDLFALHCTSPPVQKFFHCQSPQTASQTSRVKFICLHTRLLGISGRMGRLTRSARQVPEGNDGEKNSDT